MARIPLYYFILMFRPHPPFSADSLCPQTTGTYRSCKQEHGALGSSQGTLSGMGALGLSKGILSGMGALGVSQDTLSGWMLWAHPQVKNLERVRSCYYY